MIEENINIKYSVSKTSYPKTKPNLTWGSGA